MARIPELPGLTLQTEQRNSATYLAFSAFDFQDAWRTLEEFGAVSCNIIPCSEEDCIEIEVFFSNHRARTTKTNREYWDTGDDTSKGNTEGNKPLYATWQYCVATVSGIAILASACL